MSIQYQTLSYGQLMDANNFPAVLEKFEKFVRGIYDDGKHIATIGIGTNVQDVKNYLALTLKELGVFTTIANETDAQRNNRYDTIINRFSKIIKDNPLSRNVTAFPTPGTSPSEKALQAKLDALLAEYLPGKIFKLDEDKIQAINIVRQIVNGFEIAPDTNPVDGLTNGTYLKTEGKATTLDNKLKKYGVVIDHNTKEYIALLSLQFNTKAGPTDLIGKGILQALKDGNRAEAWYEIRYNSNIGALNTTPPNTANGTAKRRFYEADIFSLYDTNDTASGLDESLQVYQMYTAHRDQILKYEATYGNIMGQAGTRGDWIAQANIDYHLSSTPEDDTSTQVNTLHAELFSSATKLVAEYIKDEYGVSRDFNPLNIQVASAIHSTLKGEDSATRTGSNEDLLIGRDLPGYLGVDFLYGGDGNDTLIGLDGNDYLNGGAGDDTLIGGAGEDTYVISGHDRIIDEGTNFIIFRDKNGIEVTAAGTFTSVSGGSSFVSDEKNFNGTPKYTFSFNSPGVLTLSADDSVTFVNQTSASAFADHDFGITLQEEDPDDFDITLTGSAYRNEMGIFDIGLDQKNWQLYFVSFPDPHWVNLHGSGWSDDPASWQDPEDENSPVILYEENLPEIAPRMKITGGDAGNFLFGFAGHDEITGGAGGDIITGYLGYWNGKELTMSGDLEGDLLDGGDGGDWVQGTGEIDQIIGGGGNDLLSGFDGDDSIRGDAGNDVLAGASHADTLSGGGGDDILLGEGYLTGSLSLTLDNLSTLGFTLTGSPDGYYTGYTTRNFAIHNDAPNGGDDVLLGGAGRDWLEGGVGADILDGGTEHDSLFGGAGDDWLSGGDGNDWMVGDSRDPAVIGDDIMLGGAGDDTYVVNSVDDVVIEEVGEGTDTIQSSVSFALPENVESITFTGGGDLNATGNASDNLLGGTSGANILSGNAGNDTVEGFAGNDLLDGGEGLDWMTGGLGDDTYVVDDTGDVVAENAGEGVDTVQSSISYSLGASVENLILTGDDALNGTGNDLDNMITGNSGANILDGGTGSDTLTGGGDSDELSGGAGRDAYVFNLGDGSDTIIDAAENGIGNTITFTEGITRDDIVLQQEGNILTIHYGTLGDRIRIANFDPSGGNGSLVVDTFTFADGSSVSYDELATNHAPTVNAPLTDQTATEDQLFSFQVPVDTFQDSDAGDQLVFTSTLADGSPLPSWLTFDSITRTFSGTPVNEDVGILSIKTTATDLAGEKADSGFTLNVANVNDAPIVNGDLPTLLMFVNSPLTYTMPEGTITDPDKGDILSYSATLSDGSALPSWLSFDAATRTFSGMPTSIGTVSVRLTAVDIGNESVSADFDITVNPQDLQHIGTNYVTILNGGTGNDILHGLAGIDILEGNAGDDILFGYDGNDTLMGRSGADTMFGGLGNDFYQVDNPNDIVFENENEGDDRVVSNITSTLGANVENLTLTGSTAINGTGNELDNVIFGNPGANILAGCSGNDRIAGSFGKDTFVFDTELSSSTNVDTITDFFVGQDKIQLDKDIFTALKDDGVLSSAFFMASANGAAVDDNDYFLYNTTSGALFYDADGNGQGVAVQFATLTNKAKISATDFMIAS